MQSYWTVHSAELRDIIIGLVAKSSFYWILNKVIVFVCLKSAHNPIATAPPGYNSSFFRDPTTSWQGPDGEWRILVGSNMGTGGIIGTALVYKSKDFQTWSFEHPLHEVPGTGMWECPDFYPVALSGSKLGLDTSVLGASQKHVLKISSNNLRHDYYSVGTYYFNNQTYEPDIKQLDTAIGLRYDYGNYYASKTFFDQHKGRRILLGWVNESDTAQEDIAKGWSSIQVLVLESLCELCFSVSSHIVA